MKKSKPGDPETGNQKFLVMNTKKLGAKTPKNSLKNGFKKFIKTIEEFPNFSIIWLVGVVVLPLIFWALHESSVIDHEFFMISVLCSIGGGFFTALLVIFLKNRGVEDFPEDCVLLWGGIPIGLSVWILWPEIDLSLSKKIILGAGTIAYFFAVYLTRGVGFFLRKNHKYFVNRQRHNSHRIIQLILPVWAGVIFLGTDWYWTAVPLALSMILISRYLENSSKQITLGIISTLFLAVPIIGFAVWAWSVIWWIVGIFIAIFLILFLLFAIRKIRSKIRNFKKDLETIKERRNHGESEAKDNAARIQLLKKMLDLTSQQNPSVTEKMEFLENFKKEISPNPLIPGSWANSTEFIQKFKFSELVEMLRPEDRILLASKLEKTTNDPFPVTISAEHKRLNFDSDQRNMIIRTSWIIGILISSLDDLRVQQGKKLLAKLPEISAGYTGRIPWYSLVFSEISSNCDNYGSKILRENWTGPKTVIQ